MHRRVRVIVLVAIFLLTSSNIFHWVHHHHHLSFHRQVLLHNNTAAAVGTHSLRQQLRPPFANVRNDERFPALPRCPIPHSTPAWHYYDALVQHNARLAAHARQATAEAQYRTQEQAPSRIPHRLVFTHKDDLFDCATSASNATPPDLYALAENAKATVAAYGRLWPDLECVFLTNKDCIDALSDTEPELIPWFNNLTGMYKADLCRAAFLFLNGGYYFDVDIVTVRPFVAPQDATFVTVKGDGFPRDGFFQAFLAVEQGSVIVRRSLGIMLAALRGERSKGKHLGPSALMEAWMEVNQETDAFHLTADTKSVYLLTEVALHVPRSIRKYMKLANVLASENGFGMYQHVPSGHGDSCQFSAGACNFVVVDELDQTLYFYSRALGTSLCGKRMLENGACTTEENLLERIRQSKPH